MIPERLLAGAAGLALLGCGGAPSEGPRRLAVAAASSLRELLERTAVLFEDARPGTRIVYSFEASSVLARRIEAGAALDLFLSADRETLARAGDRVVAATAVPFLGNRLALVVRKDLARALESPADLARLRGRLALAGPAVPAGRYARAFLEEKGWLRELGPRIANAESVRAALALVESGAADGAFVYETDARLAKEARLAWVAAPGEGPEILYFGAVLAGGEEALAREVLAFLRGPAFLSAARAMGFLPPPR
ncbi:MAG TPA: molybdate ABC transporter substrate-binding protein [Planctomycetota bacterium]|nr:molybdate ABC transporter substrate-binding protein [Planctomycetota bacterium]